MEIDVRINSFSVHAELSLCDLIGSSISFNDSFENDSYFVFFSGGEITVVDKKNYRLARGKTLVDSNVYFSAERYLCESSNAENYPFIRLSTADGNKANGIISELFLSKNSYKKTKVVISALEAKYNQRNEELHALCNFSDENLA